MINKSRYPNTALTLTALHIKKSKCITQQNKTSLVELPLTALGQETRRLILQCSPSPCRESYWQQAIHDICGRKNI